MTFEPLTAMDSVFVTMDSANAPLHIGVVLELEPRDPSVYDPQRRFEEIRATIEERLGKIAVLRRRVLRVPFDLGPPVLIDDPDFDLDFHIVRRAVPAPGGGAQLEALIGRIMARSLSPDRPLWEVSVIEGLEGGSTALLMKVHHALADGVAGVKVFAGLFDIDPEMPTVELADDLEDAPPVPSPVELLARSSSELLRRPGAVLEAIGLSLERLAGKVDELVGTASGDAGGSATPSILDAPKTSLSGTVSYARHFERFELDLGAVKTAAKAQGATVTDFAMTCVGGALRRLLELRGEASEKDLVAFVPVNIRRPGTEGDLGNQISGRLVQLQTQIGDPARRLHALGECSRAARESVDEPASDLLNEVAEAAGPAVASLAGKIINAFELFDHLPNVANVIVSSVPGPPVPLWCAGERIVRASPMGPLMFNQALNITLMSYCGTLQFGTLACARKVPDAAVLNELMFEEASKLLDGEQPLILVSSSS